ncbi:MAG: hypothetical protein R8K21_08635 [Mariprofundales bacterium]
MIITLFLPWLLLPLMLNIRIFPFVAPYEEPRWLLFVLVHYLFCYLLVRISFGVDCGNGIGVINI